MIKPALFLGTALISLNAIAASLADLSGALSKAATKPVQPLSKIIYGGRDIKHAQLADANSETCWENSLSQVG